MKFPVMAVSVMFVLMTIVGCGKVEWFPDTRQPDPFAFGTKTNVKTNALVTSDRVSVKGNTSATTISVSSGSSSEVSIDDGKTWFSGSATFKAGDNSVIVRHISAKTSNTPTVTTVRIADKEATFISVTRSDASIALSAVLGSETAVSSINFKLTLPASAYLMTNADGSIDQNTAFVSGVLPGTATLKLLQYSAPTQASSASVLINLMSTNSYSPLKPVPGEFMTLNIQYPTGAAISSKGVTFSDIVFNNLSGLPIKAGTITFKNVTSSQ